MAHKLFGSKFCGAIPEQAPAYPQTWTCPEAHTIIATVEGSEDQLKELLSYTPFEYETNMFQIWIADLKGHSLAPETGGYLESAITIPVRFGDKIGGYSPWMFCTSEVAVLCGREILGYNKQMADITFIDTDTAVCATVKKNGTELIRLGFSFEDENRKVINKEQLDRIQKMNVNRILYKTFPKCDANTADFGQVIYRDSARKTGTKYYGFGSAFLGGNDKYPLDFLDIKKVLGATYTISNYGGGIEAEKRTILKEYRF